MAIPKNFRQTHYERMAAEDAVLYLPKGKQSTTPPHQQPNYQVYEVKLKGKSDKPILISGNELTTPLQLSLLKALDMLAEFRGWGGGGPGGSGADRGEIVKRRGQPKVKLYFLEDLSDIADGYSPVSGEISYRLMDLTDDPADPRPKIQRGDVERLANKIRSLFYLPTPYVWKKGREMVSFNHWERGYQFQVLCRSEAAGVELITKVLTIQDDAFDGKRANRVTRIDEAGAYPTIPPTVSIFGQSVRAPRKRPVADVKFTAAYLSLYYWPQEIILIDEAGEILPNSAIF